MDSKCSYNATLILGLPFVGKFIIYSSTVTLILFIIFVNNFAISDKL